MTTAAISSGTLVNNRYLIEKVLGEGGFGRSYLVIDKQSLNQPAVLKEFIYSNSRSQKKALELFQREAKILSKLQHPQIPQFLDWFQEKGRLFLAMEYVDGQTYTQLLAERLQVGQVFSEAEVKQWLHEILNVLAYIHQQKAIHRDIAPDNIMLSRHQNKPMLIDFGGVKQIISHLYEDDDCNYPVKPTVIIKQGYSAPELHTGDCYCSSDLYSLAVTAIELLTGKNPDSLYDSRYLAWKWHSDANISEHLTKILDKMLATKPQERYQSASEVIRALQMNPKKQASEVVTKLSQPPLINYSAQRIFSKPLTFMLISLAVITITPFFIPPTFKDYFGFKLTNLISRAKFQEYSNDDYHLTLKYPQNWSLIENEPSMITGFSVEIIASEQSQSKFKPQVTVDVIELNKPMSLDELIAIAKKQIKSGFIDVQLNEVQNTTLGKSRAYKLIYTGIEAEEKIQSMQIGTAKNNREYILTYQAEESEYQKFLQPAERIIASWQLSNPN